MRGAMGVMLVSSDMNVAGHSDVAHEVGSSLQIPIVA
jgi:hypothetical protein